MTIAVESRLDSTWPLLWQPTLGCTALTVLYFPNSLLVLSKSLLATIYLFNLFESHPFVGVHSAACPFSDPATHCLHPKTTSPQIGHELLNLTRKQRATVHPPPFIIRSFPLSFQSPCIQSLPFLFTVFHSNSLHVPLLRRTTTRSRQRLCSVVEGIQQGHGARSALLPPHRPGRAWLDLLRHFIRFLRPHRHHVPQRDLDIRIRRHPAINRLQSLSSRPRRCIPGWPSRCHVSDSRRRKCARRRARAEISPQRYV